MMRAPLSQLTLHKLEVFCAVAEARSVTRAAERLGIAQPVVTTHLRALAEKLGVPLTRREGRGLRLTEGGERVYRWAREVVQRSAEIERELAGTVVGSVGRATLAASMTTGSYVLPRHLVAFRAQNPGAEIAIRVETPAQVVEAVRSGACDAAFSILDPRLDLAGLEIVPVCDERLVAVTAPGRAPSPAPASPQDLARLDFVTAQAGTARRVIEDQLLLSHGISQRRIVMELGHAEAIKQAVRAGAGAAFLFEASVRDELASGRLHQLDVPGLAPAVPVYRLTRAGRTLSPVQRNLVAFLSTALAEDRPEAPAKPPR
jgi:DNA-binding transcriptional LysR family regulator